MSDTNIVRIKFGSHLYGTSTPESDTDYKAVHMPSASSILLQRTKDTITHTRSKAAGEKNNAEDIDEESYSLQRYLYLLATGQTVALDMLFAPPAVILNSVPPWELIQENRDKFLTKKSAAFVGYCRQQANKYGIKGSRVAAAKAASYLFQNAWDRLGSQAKVAEIEQELRAIQAEHLQIVELPMGSKANAMGLFVDCCNRKVSFTTTIKQAALVYTAIYDNYGARARMAETNQGVDWKALSHAVRVGQEALELLRTHHITFPLPDAAHILAIKQGKLPYEQVAEEIEQLLTNVEEASVISTLPDSADHAFIDYLVTECYLRKVKELL